MRVINLTLGDKGKIESVDWVAWIMNEIEGKAFTRKDVATTYAILIQSGHRDWAPINEAIIKRWSKSGWQWIKALFRLHAYDLHCKWLRQFAYIHPLDAWRHTIQKYDFIACWCPLSQPCHADILLELANQ